MGDEHGISWPDGGMCASDSKGTFAPRIKHKQLFSPSDEINHLRARNAELEAEITHLTKDLSNGLTIIKKLETQIVDMKAKSYKWLPEYLQAKKEIADLKDKIIDLQQLESATKTAEGIRRDVTEPLIEAKLKGLEAEVARLRKALEATREYLMGGKWIYDKSPDEFIKSALEASDG